MTTEDRPFRAASLRVLDMAVSQMRTSMSFGHLNDYGRGRIDGFIEAIIAIEGFDEGDDSWIRALINYKATEPER